MLKRFFHYPRYIDEVLRSIDLQKVPAETIMALWETIHSNDPLTITKTISSMQFDLLSERLELNPSFLFPCTSSSSKQITLISEILEENCISLSDMEDEDSRPLLLLRMFPELSSSKLIVPVRGDIISNSLQKKTSQSVLHNFIRFYTDSDLFEAYVKTFNHHFEHFDYESFLKNWICIQVN
jgi:hypothetical protein